MIIGVFSLASALVAPSADLGVAKQLFQEIAAARLSSPLKERLFQAVTLDVDPDGKLLPAIREKDRVIRPASEKSVPWLSASNTSLQKSK